MICTRTVKYGQVIRMSASSRLLAQIFLSPKKYVGVEGAKNIASVRKLAGGK